MEAAPESEATTKNEATSEGSTLPGKRKLCDSMVGSGRSSKVQATTPGRMTRSRFKKMNENSATPDSLNPGLEMQPHRRREPGGRKAKAAATLPRDTADEVPEVPPETAGDISAPHSNVRREVSEADIAAASRLAQAAIEAGLTSPLPTWGDARMSELSHGHKGLFRHNLEHISQVVTDAEATQDGTPPTQPDATLLALLTVTLSASQDDGEPPNSNRGADNDQPRPVMTVEQSTNQERVEAVGTGPEAVREAPEGRAAAGDDNSQEEPKGQEPTPPPPDKADNLRAQCESSASEQLHSPTKARISDEDKASTIPTPSSVQSSGIGSEADSPDQGQSSGGVESTQYWPPRAIGARYAADIPRIVGPVEHQNLTGPAPLAVSQWEPDSPSNDGRGYSPEVFEGDLEQFELQEWDDDVDP